MKKSVKKQVREGEKVKKERKEGNQRGKRTRMGDEKRTKRMNLLEHIQFVLHCKTRQSRMQCFHDNKHFQRFVRIISMLKKD